MKSVQIGIDVRKKLLENAKFMASAEKEENEASFEIPKILFDILHKTEIEAAFHSERVAAISLFIAEKIGISDFTEKRDIYCGGLLHDIGKITIPGRILNKPGYLTEEEKKIVQKHVKAGFSIISQIPSLKGVANLVLQHHERFDGKEYPFGMSGKDILLGSRILAAADTFDALRSERSYHKAITFKEAMNEVNRQSGFQFDPDIVAVYNKYEEEINKIFEKIKIP